MPISNVLLAYYINLSISFYSLPNDTTIFIAYRISETIPPVYLIKSSLSKVTFYTSIPNVPRIIKNTGKYAISVKAYIFPV